MHPCFIFCWFSYVAYIWICKALFYILIPSFPAVGYSSHGSCALASRTTGVGVLVWVWDCELHFYLVLCLPVAL